MGSRHLKGQEYLTQPKVNVTKSEPELLGRVSAYILGSFGSIEAQTEDYKSDTEDPPDTSKSSHVINQCSHITRRRYDSVKFK